MIHDKQRTLGGHSVSVMQRRPHMQSMILFMDREAVMPIINLYRCFTAKFDAIFEGESRNLLTLLRRNYSIFSLHSEFQRDQKDWNKCTHEYPHSTHPYEVIFIKVQNNVVPELVEAVTQSVQSRLTRSKDFCAPRLNLPTINEKSSFM